MSLIAWTYDKEKHWGPHFVEPNQSVTVCGLKVEHNCRHDTNVAEVICHGCHPTTTFLTLKLSAGWHDLNTEDRLKALLEQVGIEASDELIDRAVSEMTPTLERGKIYEISPQKIHPRASQMHPPSVSSIQKQTARLIAEGQIEPIQVFQCVNHGKLEIQEDAWTYAEAQVEAAKALGWPTLLVTLDEE
jgi:hypothetical protein